MKERIQKVLANAGVASRRNIEEMVLQGRIAVNGQVVRRLPVLIDPQEDRVTVDDETVKLAKGGAAGAKRVYVLMNKPKGVLSTMVAQGEQVRAVDLLPKGFPARVYPVGTLDAESKGLLLLTNDGELTNRLTHPRYGVAKTYRAVIDGFMKDETIEEMQEGVWLADAKTGRGFKTGRSQIKVVKRTPERSIVDITMREGRNRELRRVMARFGHKVRDLTRTKMGPLTLEKMTPGEFRMLSGREIKELQQTGKHARERGKHPPRDREIAD